jgi:hypothetical protein
MSRDFIAAPIGPEARPAATHLPDRTRVRSMAFGSPGLVESRVDDTIPQASEV